MVMVDTVPRAIRHRLICKERTAAYPPVVPNFHRVQNRETDNLETTLQELRDAGICTGIEDDVGHDVVSVEVVERDDHPPGGSRGIEGIDRGERLSITGVIGDVGTI